MPDVAVSDRAAGQEADLVARLLDIDRVSEPGHPYELYDEIRSAGPVVRGGDGRWFAADYATVKAVLRSSAFGRRRLARRGRVPGEMGRLNELVFLNLDPPDHTRLRSTVSTAFTPKRVARVHAFIAERASALVEACEQRGDFDIVGDFAHPLALSVAGHILGVPDAELPRLERWAIDLAPVGDLVPLPRSMALDAWRSMLDFVVYFRDMLATRVRVSRPHSDEILTSLLTAQDSGAHLTDDELLATSILLLLGSYETTKNVVANGCATLLLRPDLIAGAFTSTAAAQIMVDEVVRFESPVQLSNRFAVEPVDLGGRSIEPGDEVVAIIGAANRDPAVFAQPNDFLPGRQPNPHVGFGSGIHYCLGAGLARVEAAEALRGIAALLQRSTLRDGMRWWPSATLRKLAALPVAVGATP